MKAKKLPAKASYDLETDTFSAMPLERSYKSSFQKGDLIFDLDNEGKIVGLEILNASVNFGIPKTFLKNLVEIKIDLLVTKETINLKVMVKSFVRNAEKISSLNFEKIKPDFVNPSKLNLAVV